MSELLRIATIGHLPPPITGENICRERLEAALIKLGYHVKPYSRNPFRLWRVGGEAVVIVNGQSILGTLIDIAFCTLQVVLGRKVFFYFHNRSWRRYGAWVRLWRLRPKSSVKALVLTSAIRQWLVERGLQAVVLNNTAGAEFEHLAPGPRVRRILWMGRPDAVKGFDLALAAFQLLYASDPSWRFDVYGSHGEGFRPISGVKFHGFVRDRAKLEVFEGAGIFILPSQYVNETQPLSIIEALAAGCPVVASDVGGIPEMIRTPLGDGGLIVRERTALAYAAAVKACFDDYALLSQNARVIYQEYFSYDRFWTNLVEIFGVPAAVATDRETTARSPKTC